MIKEKLYNPKRIHRHKWQKGQLLIYNNKATNHKRENDKKTFMENCVVREITFIDEYIELCEIASKSNHPNASNYNVDKMKKRWNKYLIFTKLTRGDEVISFAGIIDFGNNLVRLSDRLYTKQEYRQNYMTKSIANL